MQKARHGDLITIECPHGGIGIIESSSPDVFDNGEGAARVGDTTICLVCGMPGTIITGSSSVYNNMRQAARVGDMTTGTCNLGLPCCPHSRTGIIQTGSPSTYIGG